MKTMLAAYLVAMLQAGAMAQATWTQVANAPPLPAPRESHAIAYDSQRARIVVFGGGVYGVGYGGDTWEWDGTTGIWTQVATTGPAARKGHAMAYDSQRGRTVLFGGFDNNTIYADTWEWDGSTWSQVANSGPVARCYHAMAYDSQLGRTVLFGGQAAGTYI
jgi:hypothetical protein